MQHLLRRQTARVINVNVMNAGSMSTKPWSQGPITARTNSVYGPQRFAKATAFRHHSLSYLSGICMVVTYLICGELLAAELAAAAAAAAAAAMELIPGSCSFWEAVVEAELGRDIGSRIAGGERPVAPSSILIARKVKGGSWHGWSGGGVKAGYGKGSGSRGERVGASLTIGRAVVCGSGRIAAGG